MKGNYNYLIDKFRGKKILAYGIGRSNIPLIDILTNHNIEVCVYDKKSKKNFPKKTIEELEKNKYVKLYLADDTIWSKHIDVIVRTPGVNFNDEKITSAIKNGSTITSEMELFFEICPCKIIGITGSDGKTTVSTLISEMLKAQKIKVHLGGNIGIPLLPKIQNINQNDIVVAELSSFQLISMKRSPDIAIVTNISPNHLDIHKNMEEYVTAKKQILLHQLPSSKTILNFDCLETKKMAHFVRGKTIFFSKKQKINNGTWLDNNENIIFSDQNNNKIIMNKNEIKIPGKHNLENYLAAISAVQDFVEPENIKKVANSFTGIPHRIEFIKTINGVSYYNDSIASTPTRTINGCLSLFDKKIILIAGGYNKNVSFESLAEKIIEKVSFLILLGESSDCIEKEILQSKKYNPEKLKIIKASSMNNAVKIAFDFSQTGDIVVLSPACASFDMYKDFEERGNHFKKIVNNLKQQGAF